MSCLNKFVKRNFLWILLALLLAGSHLLYLYLLPASVEDIEQLYGQILENVAIQQRLLENQTQLQQTEMYDYYARWVHQIKTPIAALQLLLETQKKDVAKNAETILEKTGKENAVLENLLE